MMTATTLSALPFCASLASRDVSFPAHVVRRIAALARIRSRRPEYWYNTEEEVIGDVLARALRQRAPRRPVSDNGRLADWQSFRAMARKAGCTSMVTAWEIWTTPMSWRQKCDALRGQH